MLRTFFIRLGIILFCLAFIAQITAFLVFPDAVIEVAERIKGQERTIRVLLALLAVLADLVLLQVIYRELRFRRYQGEGLIARSREANVQVSLESVRDNVKTQVSRLSDLYSVDVAVQPERGKVAMSLDITAAETINVRKKTSEIHREIVKVVERQMGLRLADRPVLRFNMAKNKAATVVTPPPMPAAEARPKTGVFGRSKTEPTPPPTPVYTPPPSPPPPMRTPTPPPSRFPTPPPIIEAEHITPPEMPIMTTDEGEVFEVKTTKTDEEAAT